MVTYDELLKNITAHLRGRREKAGFTQDQIARVLNVNRSTISRFENGEVDSIILYYRYVTALSVMSVLINRGKADENE